MINCLLLSFILSSVMSARLPTENYANELVLVEPDVYYLYWNYTDKEILFELHVKNEGWNAFGISPTGGMPNSDVIVTWVNDDGSTHFTDRHITQDLSVLVDKEQDWIPLLVKKKDGYTISKFTRKIKRCDDSNEDLDIPEGTPFIIFSWGTNFNANGDIAYHGRNNRGNKVVPLISSLNLKVDLDESKLEIEDFRVNTTIENIDTFYYCQMFKIPTTWLNQKRHLLRYETLFSKGNEKYLHHWLFNECPLEFAKNYIEKYGMPKSGPCFSYQSSQPEISAEWNKIMNMCRKISLGWAVGGDIVQDFPSNIAYPIGGSEADFQYFFLQIHYDNPELNKRVRLYLSQEYRPVEFGVLTVGTVSDFTGLIVPPNAERFIADYACRKECTTHLFENVPEVNVFTTLPHTHLIGKEVYSKIIREGKEIGYITNNRFYDFNYQYYNFLAKPFTLKMDDEIYTTCIYKSKNKKGFVQGGHSTAEEMCLNFIWYYPRKSGIGTCFELYNPMSLATFLTNLNKTGEITLKNFTNINLANVGSLPPISIETSNPNEDLVKKFQAFHDSSNRIHFCSFYGNQSVMSVTPFKYESIETETCETDTNNTYLINTTPTPTKQPNNADTIRISKLLFFYSLFILISKFYSSDIFNSN